MDSSIFRSWGWAPSPALFQCSRLEMVSSSRLCPRRATHWRLTPTDPPRLKSSPGNCQDRGNFSPWSGHTFKMYVFSSDKPWNLWGPRLDHPRRLAKMLSLLSNQWTPSWQLSASWRKRIKSSVMDVHQWVPGNPTPHISLTRTHTHTHTRQHLICCFWLQM